MFTKENLETIFKGKEFGYGQWHLYFHSKSYDSEEGIVSVNIMDGIVEIAEWNTNDKHEPTDVEIIVYIPFELITDIQFGKDF